MTGTAVSSERRFAQKTDRRKQSRSGRRGTDPSEGRRRGFRVVWMFAGYLLYAGLRTLSTLFRRVRRA
jgi:hypothetical protein